jgi:hypothetical protein
MTRECSVCHRAEDHSLDAREKFKIELRPYGTSGGLICFDCATDPTRIEATRANLGRILDNAQRITKAALLTPDGPVPFLVGKGRP